MRARARPHAVAPLVLAALAACPPPPETPGIPTPPAPASGPEAQGHPDDPAGQPATEAAPPEWVPYLDSDRIAVFRTTVRSRIGERTSEREIEERLQAAPIGRADRLTRWSVRSELVSEIVEQTSDESRLRAGDTWIPLTPADGSGDPLLVPGVLGRDWSVSVRPLPGTAREIDGSTRACRTVSMEWAPLEREASSGDSAPPDPGFPVARSRTDERTWCDGIGLFEQRESTHWGNASREVHRLWLRSEPTSLGAPPPEHEGAVPVPNRQRAGEPPPTELPGSDAPLPE